jgi:cyclase
MLRPRITPCLLLRDGALVKTTRFGSPKYIGDPINAVKIFNEKEADELIVLDIDATVRGKEPNFHLLAQLAVECRMPLCYGGGIKSPDQARRIIELGVEKVAIGSAAVEDPPLLSAIASEVGGQSVVAVIDVLMSGSTMPYEVTTRNGTRRTNRPPLDVAQEAEHRGAGEILLNVIDKDGMLSGYDLALANLVRMGIGIPMTVLGGAGSLKDIGALLEACGIVGAAAGSLFVFKGPYRAVLISYPTQSQRDEVFRRVLK